MPTQATLTSLARRLGRQLQARKQRVATAESCTGGWVAKALTDIAGSSEWFEAGYVTYSNAAKQRDLGVRRNTLERHGAVSEAVVREMARGALRAASADCAVAISGVAGPGGGTTEKPVGLVWFCWAQRRGRGVQLLTGRCQLSGGRGQVRAAAVEMALRGLLAL